MAGVWIDRVHDRRPPKMIILDMDSSVSPTYGDQESSAYNGHFGRTCYHPLFDTEKLQFRFPRRVRHDRAPNIAARY